MSELERIRRSKGIKKQAVCDALGVSWPTYNRWEKRPEKMPAAKLKQACSFMGIDERDIFLSLDVN